MSDLTGELMRDLDRRLQPQLGSRISGKVVKFDVPVARDVGIGRAALAVAAHERLEHLVPVLALEADVAEPDPELRAHPQLGNDLHHGLTQGCKYLAAVEDIPTCSWKHKPSGLNP